MTKEEKSLNYYLERKYAVKEYKRLSWTENMSEEEKEFFIKKDGMFLRWGNTETL